MEVRAIAKNVRTSPQKVTIVIDQIKKMKPEEAIKILDFVPRSASSAIKKVILSAIANAKNNFGLAPESLMFKELTVSKGSVFKRFRAVARGRAHPILKRTSHIKVVLEGEQKKEVAKIPEASEASKVSQVSKESKDENQKLNKRELISDKSESKNQK